MEMMATRTEDAETREVSVIIRYMFLVPTLVIGVPRTYKSRPYNVFTMSSVVLFVIELA